MLNTSVGQVAKQSIVYSYVLAQPFMQSYPILQNELLLQSETLTYETHSHEVRILQKKLKTLDLYEAKIDGDYGLLTEYAIKQFQRENDLFISGQANQETIQAIVKKDIAHHYERLEEMSHVIHKGMHSHDVKIIQQSLQYFGYYTGEIDGIYGPLTEVAIEEVEKDHEITLIDHHAAIELAPVYETEIESVDQSADQLAEEASEQAETETNEEKTEEMELEHNDPQRIPVEATGAENVIQAAESLIGTPYVWGGDSPSGFDCSGFIQFVYETQDQTVPRTVSDMWNFTQPVDEPSIGDLVFFETYQAGPSHMGLYIGNGEFIHAGTTNGVETSDLSNTYWQDRYLGAKRVEF